MLRRCQTLCLILIAPALLSSCAKTPAPRPGPGDKVFPIVTCPKSFQAGGPVVITVRLGMQGADDPKPLLLKFEDVPLEPDLRASFTFFKNDEVVQSCTDVKLVPDC